MPLVLTMIVIGMPIMVVDDDLPDVDDVDDAVLGCARKGLTP